MDVCPGVPGVPYSECRTFAKHDHWSETSEEKKIIHFPLNFTLKGWYSVHLWNIISLSTWKYYFSSSLNLWISDLKILMSGSSVWKGCMHCWRSSVHCIVVADHDQSEAEQPGEINIDNLRWVCSYSAAESFSHSWMVHLEMHFLWSMMLNHHSLSIFNNKERFKSNNKIR